MRTLRQAGPAESVTPLANGSSNNRTGPTASRRGRGRDLHRQRLGARSGRETSIASRTYAKSPDHHRRGDTQQ
jgi:hypothetical protein